MEQFTYVKRGYDPEEVDKYITTLEQVVKSYKDKDNAIKNALISAQAAADNVLRGAQSQAEAYKVQISEQLVDMRATLDKQRASLQKFEEGYSNVVRMCIQELQQFNMGEMFARLDEMDEAIADLQGLEALSGGKDNFLPHDTSKDSRGYGRDAMPEASAGRSALPVHGHEAMRDRAPIIRDDRRDMMYEDDRDVMRGRDTVSSDDRDMMRSRDMMGSDDRDMPRGRDTMVSDDRDMMRSQDMMHAPHDAMRDYGHGRDIAPMHEPMRDIRDSGRDMIRGRDEMPSYEPMRDIRDNSRDMLRDTGRDFTPEPTREPMRDIRDSGRDMRNDAGRDVRRDMGRDMRSDTGRSSGRYGTMRDTAMDSMRMDNREPMLREPMREPMQPMRDIGRSFMPETDDYGDNDQNLLPPVASLM